MKSHKVFTFSVTLALVLGWFFFQIPADEMMASYQVPAAAPAAESPHWEGRVTGGRATGMWIGLKMSLPLECLAPDSVEDEVNCGMFLLRYPEFLARHRMAREQNRE